MVTWTKPTWFLDPREAERVFVDMLMEAEWPVLSERLTDRHETAEAIRRRISIMDPFTFSVKGIITINLHRNQSFYISFSLPAEKVAEEWGRRLGKRVTISPVTRTHPNVRTEYDWAPRDTVTYMSLVWECQDL